MLLTQLSNIFNIITQNEPLLNYYHYGWPQDANRNIPNNYDPNSEVGRKFPYLLLLPPSKQGRVELNGSQALFETYQLELYIIDSYGYEGQQLEYKRDTMVKIDAKLENIATKVIAALETYAQYTQPEFNVGDYNMQIDALSFAGNTRNIRILLTLQFPSVCGSSDFDPEALGLPTDFNDLDSFDMEDILDTQNI